MDPRAPITPEKIAENLRRVRAQIAEAAASAKRDIASIRLVGVTKYSSNEETAALAALGVNDLGESRIQDAERKRAAVTQPGLRWHLIGHLQTNKAAKAVQIFQTIHSIDSVRVAAEIDKEARKRNCGVIDGFIEINAGGEANKFGLAPQIDLLTELLKQCAELQNLRIVGLMSMAPYADDPERVSRPVFQRVRELRDAANASAVYPRPLSELSMGMTQDFQIAIQEGATLIRVGSALFE